MSEHRIRFEECARRILQRELGRPVVLNDDGRKPGLYDLRVGDVDAPAIAIECVGAVASTRTATWNVGPAKGPLRFELKRDWHVVLKPHSSVKDIKSRLERVLQECERVGITEFTPVDWWLERHHPPIFAALDGLQVHSIAGFEVDGRGNVHLGMTGGGGAVDPYGSAVPGWIEEFLNAEQHKDVIAKLQRSSALQCHVFVGISFFGVPWDVESYLGTRTDHVPAKPPNLPSVVDAVWIMYGRRGLTWDGLGWRFFDAIVPTA